MSSWLTKKSALALIIVAFLALTAQSCNFLSRSKTDGGVLITANEGQDWTFRNAIDAKNSLDRTVTTTAAFNPKNTQEIFLGSDGSGLFVTRDGGGTWQNILSRGGTVRRILIDADQSAIYVALSRGIYKSTDDGSNFTEIYFDQTGIIADLAFDPRNHNTIYALIGNGAVLRTDNAGASWQLSADTKTQAVALLVDPMEPTTQYIATNGQGLLVSHDGGAQFASANTLAQFQGGNIVNAIVADSKTPHLVWVTTDYGLFVTRDSGQTFSEVPTVLGGNTVPLHAFAIDVENSSVIYFSAENRIYRSIDKGTTWKVISIPTARPVQDIVTTPADHQVLLVTLGSAKGQGAPQIIKPFGQNNAE